MSWMRLLELLLKKIEEHLSPDVTASVHVFVLVYEKQGKFHDGVISEDKRVMRTNS